MHVQVNILFSSTIYLIQSFDNMSYVTGDLQVIYNIFLRQYSYRVPYTITLTLHQTEALSLYILFSHNHVIIFWASTCVLHIILYQTVCKDLGMSVFFAVTVGIANDQDGKHQISNSAPN